MTASIWAPNGFSPEVIPYTLFEYTATSGQTTFSIAPFTVITDVQLKVYTGPDRAGQVNETTRYDIVGTDVVLASSVAASTYVRIEVYRAGIASGQVVTDLPDQAGHADEALFTDGTSLEWRPIPVDQLRIDLADPDKGALLVAYKNTGTGATGRTVDAKLDEYVTPFDYGGVGDGVANDAVPFELMFAEANATGKSWQIPYGTWLINGSNVIVIRTSGKCFGEIHIPKSNTACRFDILRDSPGITLNTAGWNPLVSGRVDANALNAAGKNLYLYSTEIATERFNPPSNVSYRKQEFIRCRAPSGDFTTALWNTYTSFANLTVTAHEPSRPISIEGLCVVRTGAGIPAVRGSIVCWRDNVTLKSCSVTAEIPSSPLAFGIEVGYCADCVLDSCQVSGTNYGGLGYGIVATATIGTVYRECVVSDAREAVSGAYNVDLSIVGGSYSNTVDDHWGHRMSVSFAHIRAVDGGCAFQYAGSDATMAYCQVSGGRSLFGIRTDTPSCAGKVQLVGNTVRSFGVSAEWYGFGFTSSPGTGSMAPVVFTVPPVLPSHVTIKDLTVTTNTAIAYGAKLGICQTAHTSWGKVEITGMFDVTGASVAVIGIFGDKDSTYQQTASTLIWDSPSDLGVGTALYVVAFDAVPTRGWNLYAEKLLSGSFRWSSYGVANVTAVCCNIRDLENDNVAHLFTNQRATFKDCTFSGGKINSAFRNILFADCIFNGVLTAFPSIAFVSMLNCVSPVVNPNLPANIADNVVAPWGSAVNGSYTPVNGMVANLSAVTSGVALWHRVGDFVHVAGSVVADPVAAGVLTVFTLILPIPSTLGAANTNLFGVACGLDPAQAATISHDGVFQGATISYTASAVTANTLTYQYMYRIL